MPQSPKANTLILSHVVIIWELVKNVVRGKGKMQEELGF